MGQEIGANPSLNKGGENFSPYEVLGIGFHEQFGFKAPIITLKSENNLILRERIYVKPEEGNDRVNATIRITCTYPGAYFVGRLVLQKPPPAGQKEGGEEAANSDPTTVGPAAYGDRRTWLNSLELVCTEEGKNSLLFAHLELFSNSVYILEVESAECLENENNLENLEWRLEFFGDGKIQIGNETMESDLEALVLNSWATETEVTPEERLEAGENARNKWLEEGSEGELKCTLVAGPSKITEDEGAIPEDPDKEYDDIIKDRYNHNLNKKGHVNKDVLSFLEDVLERPVYTNNNNNSTTSEEEEVPPPIEEEFDWDKFHTTSKAALDKNSKTLEKAKKWYNEMSFGQELFNKERVELISAMVSELENKQAELDAAAAAEAEGAGGQ